MKLLVFGRDGQVGRALQQSLTPLAAARPDDGAPGALVALGRADADFAAPASLAALIDDIRPDVIVNAAAYTAVDAAETDTARAFAVNAEAVGIIGAAAQRLGALVVHYSTDYVFDGTATGFYSETDRPNPLSVYGRSKLAGEVALAGSGAAHVIVRTSWVYDAAGRNFPLTILRLARERDGLDVVADQFGVPTPAWLIAEMTARIVPRALDDATARGLYHLAPHGETSWHGLAQYLLTAVQNAGAKLRCGPDAVRPMAARDYGAKAARPAHSRLDTHKLRRQLGVTLPDWQAGIDRLVATLQAEGRL